MRRWPDFRVRVMSAKSVQERFARVFCPISYNGWLVGYVQSARLGSLATPVQSIGMARLADPRRGGDGRQPESPVCGIGAKLNLRDEVRRFAARSGSALGQNVLKTARCHSGGRLCDSVAAGLRGHRASAKTRTSAVVQPP